MHDTAEEQQAALTRYRSHPKVEQLVKLVTIIGDLSEGYCDPLGELYMQAISNGHNGQYFTPEPICTLMAKMQLGEDTKELQTVADPACGSGRMLLAAAQINRSMRFYGADLDSTCCKMALLNMLLNSLQGEIAHMNTLTNEFYCCYKVHTTIVGGMHVPYYIEQTNPEHSYIWLRPVKQQQPKSTFSTPFEPVRASKPIIGVQGSLFDRM